VAVTPRNSDLAERFLAALAATMLMVAAGGAFAQSTPAPAAPASASQPAPPAAASSPAPAQSGFILPPQPPPPGAPTAATDKPSSPDKKGFDLGQWWNDSVANFKARMQEQQSKIDDFNKQSAAAAKDAATATGDAMKSAADAMVHMSTPSKVIEVQETCPIAGNGAADCATAATNACKGKGFNTGQPLDVRTAEKCNASLWVSGQPQPTTANCPEETVVLRVACQ
jgi:hypothetical protein